MKRHLVIGYSAVFIVAIVLAITMQTVFDSKYTNLREERKVELWEFAPEEKNGEFYFTFTLPKEDVADCSIAFQTAHVDIEITLDGEMVYSLYAGNPKHNKSTGYRWNFVKLTAEDAGKEMSIRIIPAYKGVTPGNQFYFGNEIDIDKTICIANAPRFLLALLILVIGLILFAYACLIVERKKADESLIHFAVFSILLAFWSIMESPICDLFGVWPVGNMVVDHYALMVMPVSFVLFIRTVFSNEDSIVWKSYICFNVVIIALRTVLQITAIRDLKQTLWMSQFSIVLFVVIGVVAGIREIRMSKLTRQMKVNLGCIFFIFATTLFELILFQVFNKRSIYAMLGFVVYVVVMSVEMVKQSRRMMERAHEAELYRKLAYTDELTGAYNRTAFQHDMDSQMTVDEKTGRTVVKPNTIFMLDLNDLKKCNDTFGHENGDRYIKMVSEVLIRIIGIDGRCYRIGGDEFCAIMPETAQNEIDNKLISIIREVQELDKKGFVVPVSVAVGYAVYNPEYDENLEDTMKRADVLMYQNKQVIKKSQNLG